MERNPQSRPTIAYVHVGAAYRALLVGDSGKALCHLLQALYPPLTYGYELPPLTKGRAWEAYRSLEARDTPTAVQILRQEFPGETA